MSSLSETAETTRQLVIVGVVMFVTIMVGWLIYQQVKGFIANIQANRPEEPTLGFNRLPALEFPEDQAADLTIQLETIGNSIPSWGPLANVYLITFRSANFLDLDNAKSKAAALGFLFDPDQITDKKYRWSKSDPLQAILDMNIVDNTFTLDVAWETDPSFLNNDAIPTEEQALSETRAYLKRADFLPDDMAEGVSEISYLKYSSGNFIESTSFEADFAQVDLFRQPLPAPKRIPVRERKEAAFIKPADPNFGVTRVLISSAKGVGKRIVSTEHRHVTVDYEQFHTYPIMTGPEAWQMLEDGNAYIASGPQSGSTAVVRDISIGYYDSLDRQQFLQPIYIFEGDDDFVAYVHAIRPEYLAQ